MIEMSEIIFVKITLTVDCYLLDFMKLRLLDLHQI